MDYPPEGVCEVAWQAGAGSVRHHCDNAAQCFVVIDDERVPSCAVCLLDLAQVGVLSYE